MFASPAKIGRLPYSYRGAQRELERAAKVAGIGHLGTHAFRHSYLMAGCSRYASSRAAEDVPQVGLEPTTLRLTARFRTTLQTKATINEQKTLSSRDAAVGCFWPVLYPVQHRIRTVEGWVRLSRQNDYALVEVA